MRTSMTIAIHAHNLQAPRLHAASPLSVERSESVQDFKAAFGPALSGARACIGRILKALHDSRRLEAAHVIARHRHLL
jgi:hypothetical protein